MNSSLKMGGLAAVFTLGMATAAFAQAPSAVGAGAGGDVGNPHAKELQSYGWNMTGPGKKMRGYTMYEVSRADGSKRMVQYYNDGRIVIPRPPAAPRGGAAGTSGGPSGR
ncbi:MAG: hypothetical protein ACRCTD_14765 [Beijerinckiaceae bacterium]